MRISDWSSDVCSSDLGRFLPAMLQGMEAKRNHGGGGFSAPHTEYAALLAQLVVVKGMCRKHRAHLSAIWRSQLVSGAHIETVKAIVASFRRWIGMRSEEHTSELQSLMRISYDVFC